MALERFTQVDANVWRGPRPKSSEYPAINAKFRTIVSLEGSLEDTVESDAMPNVLLIRRYISVWQIYVAGISPIMLGAIAGVARYCAAPVLVHCKEGKDRTGLVIAAYLVKFCNWTKEEAALEALKFGYRSWLNYGLNKTWREFDK